MGYRNTALGQTGQTWGVEGPWPLDVPSSSSLDAFSQYSINLPHPSGLLKVGSGQSAEGEGERSIPGSRHGGQEMRAVDLPAYPVGEGM